MREIVYLHPVLQQKALLLIQLCEKQGIRIRITETLRTVKEQNALYAKGRTIKGRVVTNAKGDTYSSMHQWGIAFDFCLQMDIDNDGNVTDDAYNNITRMFEKVGAIGKQIGLEWGGDWKSIKDLPHFQLPYWGSGASKLKSTYRNPQEFIDCWGDNDTISVVRCVQTSRIDIGVFKHLVADLQEALNKEFGCTLKVDGIAGAKTLAATPTLSRQTPLDRFWTIRALQNLLCHHGFDCVGDFEGIFGPRTEENVKRFQKKLLGIKGDGIVTKGAGTWKKLLQLN